ncbi:hypothetical protein [Streptomyces vinaceus]|uniref:hypothetical protein n=1 Tax=Streptomyces vinaceus TaxID=1960 RepID=UPI00382DA4A3
MRDPQHDLPGDAPPAVRHLVVDDDDPAFLASLRPELRRLADTTTEVTVGAEALEPPARSGPMPSSLTWTCHVRDRMVSCS